MRHGETFTHTATLGRHHIELDDRGHSLVHLRNGNLFNEARLFASGAELPLEHPQVYFAMPDYLNLDFLLVMEDLLERNADPRDATRPMTVNQVNNGMTALSRLHSRYWNFQRRSEPRLRWVKNWRASRGWQVVRRGHWSQDAGYFPVSALTEEDRRHCEAELLESYRDALDFPGDTKPSREEAWLWYRAGITPAFRASAPRGRRVLP